MCHTPIRSDFERDLILTRCHWLAHRHRAWQADVQWVAGQTRRMETVCKAGEVGLEAKSLIDPLFGVIHVAGKEHSDGVGPTDVQVGVLALAELKGIRRAVVRHLQDSCFGKAEAPILPYRGFPVFLQTISPQKNHRPAVFQCQNCRKRIGIGDALSLAACDPLIGGSESVLLVLLRRQEVNADASNPPCASSPKKAATSSSAPRTTPPIHQRNPAKALQLIFHAAPVQ